MTTIPPMPEPPSMRDADGRLVPDAIGFSRLVAYVQAIHDYATAGWAKFQELEAQKSALEHGPMEFMRGEILGLKAKLEEAERVNMDHALSLQIIEQAGSRAAQAAALAEALEDVAFRIPGLNAHDMRMIAATALVAYREGR